MEKSFVKNAADPQQVKEGGKKENEKHKVEALDLKTVLGTVQGRRFIWGLLCDCGIFQQSATDSGSWTYFNEGKRSVGLKLLVKINNVNPESYLQMLNESKEI